MFILPLKKFTELATMPIYSVSEWKTVPTSFNSSHRSVVTADLFCSMCEKEKTFSGNAYSREELIIKFQRENDTFNQMPYTPFLDDHDETDSVEEMIDECVLPAGDAVIVQLKCPTCNSIVYICYVIEFDDDPGRKKNVFNESDREPDQFRVHKIGEYPNQEASRLHSLEKYRARFPKEYQMLVRAERAYQNSLGAGAIVYIRKAYEILLHGVLTEHSIDRPNNFKQLLELADNAAHIVPPALSDKAYGLFGEISNLVHGDTDDEWGLEKFENLRDVFASIIDYILEKEHREQLASKIQLDKQGRKS